MNAKILVEGLLDGEEDDDVKAFIERNFKERARVDTSHFMVSSTDGGLYDTRQPNWHIRPPLRPGHTRFHQRISTLAEFKATWRARYQSNYSLAFITDDGALLCEKCAEKNLRRIMASVRGRDRDGWRVVGVSQCHGAGNEDEEVENYHSKCANCDTNLGELD